MTAYALEGGAHVKTLLRHAGESLYIWLLCFTARKP